MNSDLKLRLAHWWNLTDNENEFFTWLCYNLSWAAMKPCKKGAHVDIFVEYLPDDGEDDTAFMLGDDEHQFEIYLDKRIPLGMMIDYLIHELAHVHSWDKNEADDHGPAFGRSYARLYRQYLKLYGMWWD